VRNQAKHIYIAPYVTGESQAHVCVSLFVHKIYILIHFSSVLSQCSATVCGSMCAI